MENTKMPLRVLIREDRPEDAELMLYELRKAGFRHEALKEALAFCPLFW